MAHIQVPEGAPGILGPMAISPESTKALRQLADVLLRGPNTLTPAEREMIATYVSSENDCFCQLSHRAAAVERLGGDYDLIDRVKRNYPTAEISDKQARQHRFGRPEDRLWFTFNYRKVCPVFAAPMVFSPETTKPLCDLVQVLLTGPHSLTPAEREMIATYVSPQNDCIYCQSCHGSTAAQHLGGTDADYELIASIKQNYEATEISSNLKALLAITGKVQRGGKQITNEDIAGARQQGATDKEIHDTVLIEAAFCMYNRYVDGLATWAPTNADLYGENGRRLADEGSSSRPHT